MSRYRSYTGADDEQKLDLDPYLIGVNMKDEPDTLGIGFAQDAENKRFENKRSSCRPGVITPVFANIPAYGTTFGSAVYSNPNDSNSEWLMMAVADGVWLTREGRYPTKVSLADGITISDTVHFTQAFNKVIMQRGEDFSQLEWDGDFYGTFVEIEESDDDTDSTDLIPNSSVALYISDRLAVIDGRDNIAASDLGDYTHYAPVYTSFKINEGSDDMLTTLWPYTDNIVIAFKNQSSYFAPGVTGDLSELRLLDLSRDKGCVGQYPVVSVGDEVWFLADDGIYRVVPFQQDRLKVDPTPVSDPIQPLIDRINWNYASGACAAVWGRKVFFAVPMDDSTFNNAILVFNLSTGMWNGLDTFDSDADFHIDRFHVTDYLGVKRLYAADYTNSRFILMYEGATDEIGGTDYEIVEMVHTRAYTFQDLDFKQSTHVSFAFETIHPKISIQAITEGQNEITQLCTDLTKDRTKYYTWGKADFDITNTNGDFDVRNREDYLVRSSDAFESDSGVDPNLKQQQVERFYVRARGRRVSFKITNTQGSCDLLSTWTEAVEAGRTEKLGA
jgi:hypothetical protein